MSTLRISNIEAKSVPASATVDEKVKITNSSGDTLVFIDGKTSGITTVGINTTDSNITFDANSNVVVTGIITATRFSGEITPTSLEIGSNIKLGNAGVITATSFVGSGANLTNLPAQATIANNADNRIITGGSGVNLNGESGLTFSSDRLILTNTSTPQIRINNDTSDGSGTRFVFGKATANNNFFNGAVAGDSCIGFPSTLLFGVGASEKVRIDSDGAVFFKGSSDGTKGTINLESTDPFIRFYDTNGTADRRKWDIRLIGAGGFEELDFRTINDANNSFISRMQIEYGGDVNISDGNLRVANGHGIDFSATGNSSGSMTSELLDNYEEGTWTPTAVGFTISSTYSARYTRIGRICHISCYVRSASGSGTSTQPQIGGLPFTSQSGNTYSYGAGRIGNGGHNNAAYDIAFQQQNASTNVKFYVGDGGINESMMSNTHVIFSLVYELA